MKCCFVGDIVGKAGRQKLREVLFQLKQVYQFDTLVVNGENAAHGKGITPKIYQEFIRLGVDAITLGNHSFSKRIILDEIDACDRLIRPKNMIPTEVGKSHLILNTKEGTLAIHSIMGEVFMNNVSQNPIEAFKESLRTVKADMHFVDFHGEATAEKQTFLHVYKNDCVAIVGTHTHVQTADEMILDGCAYISDVGMTGVTHSILGRDVQEVLLNMSGEKTYYKVATGPAHLSAVIITIENKRAIDIKRVKIM